MSTTQPDQNKAKAAGFYNFRLCSEAGTRCVAKICGARVWRTVRQQPMHHMAPRAGAEPAPIKQSLAISGIKMEATTRIELV